MQYVDSQLVDTTSINDQFSGPYHSDTPENKHPLHPWIQRLCYIPNYAINQVWAGGKPLYQGLQRAYRKGFC